MADPLTILCSILTITDASKKTLDVCTEYVAHARNAPKELQTLIEDVHALNGTMKRLDNLAKSAKRTTENAWQFDQWELPLTRINKYAKDLGQLISEQDMKIGRLHELNFRARWPYHWRTAGKLLARIRSEKDRLHFETCIHGAEMVGMVFDIANERFPRTLPDAPLDSYPGSSILWEKVDGKICSRDQRETLILDKLGGYLDWPRAKYEYPAIDDRHQACVYDSAEYPRESFLESKVYKAWKTRKTRGPGLLCATGLATTGKTTLCCRVIQDLQKSNNGGCGIAYYYSRVYEYSHQQTVIQLLRFWIIQLALQCKSLPSGRLSQAVTLVEQYRLPQLSDETYSQLAWEFALRSVLQSLFTNFRRTFLFIDGLSEFNGFDFNKRTVEFLQEVLEQDFGNVSIAIFSRPLGTLEPLLELADVSIRVTQFEPDLSEYIHFKVSQKVKPLLAEAKLDHDENALAVIEKVMAEASAGLYLGVDVLIDSLVTTIRAGRNVEAFLREIRENNEIMLQRDPERMKQKAFGVETRTPVVAGVEGSSKRTNEQYDILSRDAVLINLEQDDL